jgi:iron complex outermembrane receptor protein
MRVVPNTRLRSYLYLSSAVVALACGSPALAQDANTTASQSEPPLAEATEPEIVVTGFRASLATALGQKREQTVAIDSIVAEDIGKFPDSNLAESMQRIAGVALARGDGGEGKNISVRGLGAGFTRVRINGMEGTSLAGYSDIYGPSSSARSFDFNTFPTEIFSSLAVRKTQSADVEEGSLGATVDLAAPKPMDSKQDFVLAATARATYSEVAKDAGPRASILLSKKFGDGRWGVLASAAYQQRELREVGYSAVDILSANTNGLFCSPIGVTPIYPFDAAKGATAQNCSTGNPRTGTVGAYNSILGLTRPDLPNTPGSGAFLPRIPRFMSVTQDQRRLAGTLTLQFQPDSDTDISVDLLYSKFKVNRLDTDIGALSFGRTISNNGQPMTSVKDIAFDENGSLVYGLFDGVDILADSQVDNFTSEFKQANLNFKHRFTDTLTLTGLFGLNRSELNNTQRRQSFMNAVDVDNFSIDFRNGRGAPIISLGFDPSDPNAYVFGTTLPDGTQRGTFNFQSVPRLTTTAGLTAEMNADWKIANALSLRFGGQYRQSHYRLSNRVPYASDAAMRNLPPGLTIADITTSITGLDSLWGHGGPSSYLVIDPAKLNDVLNLDAVRFCGVECGAADTRIREDVSSGYVMANFNLRDSVGIPIRGDLGVRFVHTDLRSSGYVSVANAASPTGVNGQYGSVRRSYDDWLPSANIVVEPVEDLLLRFSASKVMSRPELSLLAPTSGVIAANRVGNVNNPFLNPIRANAFDVAAEWYFRPGSLLSVALFYKDIKSFIQNVTTIVPFNTLGLPDALLANSNTLPSDLFTVTGPLNTPGGKLKGVEFNAQIPFNFLPGFLGNFGMLANYTHATSKITYILTSANGVPTTTTTANLVGLSPNTASGTLYYEDSKFSIRGTANWRDRFIRLIPASPGSDFQGNAPTLYVDASASYNFTDKWKLILEVQNITDEQNRLYVDSKRQDTLYETRVGRTVSAGVNYRW